MTSFTVILKDPPMKCDNKDIHDEHVWYRTHVNAGTLISQTCEGVSNVPDSLKTEIMQAIVENVLAEMTDAYANQVQNIANYATKDIVKAIERNMKP